MYEHITFESIMTRMLGMIPSNMDKREGSIIYDALAPCAVELQLMYIELDVILTETFGDTASREYLIRRAKERGLTPYEASYAYLRGVFDIEVPIGERFSCEDLNYVVAEQLGPCEYMLQCETVGVIGNRTFGDLIPVNYVDGLKSAELVELLIPGEDEEETEAFRTRYLASFDSKAYGGNIQDYLEKTNSIQGVGATKVTPVWAGGGTVKLTIIDSEYNIATSELISLVQETMDPTGDAHGVGVAPIGHVVTVDTVENIPIDIKTTVVFDGSYTFGTALPSITQLVEDYFLELRTDWANQNNTIVRIAQIESRIMNLPGVLDIMDTTLNDSTANFLLTEFQLPTLGVISSA